MGQHKDTIESGIGRAELLSRLPDGWRFDPLDDGDPHFVRAENLDTDAKLSRSVEIDVEYADHDHFNTRYWATHVAEHALPNVGPEENTAQLETLSEAVDQAVDWAKNPPN